MSSKLILGTVQFGLNYGINNSTGKPSESEVFTILDIAHEAGISYLDTAAAYGDAEKLIGAFHSTNANKHFKIITKFHYDKAETVKDKLARARKKLAIHHIDVLLFHSFNDYKENSQVIEALKEERANERLGSIGVSVYHNHEIEELLEDDSVEVIQLPFNLLDNEQQRGAVLEKAKAKGKIIHARSAFLQGLFFKPLNELPNFTTPLRSALMDIQTIAESSQLAINELALAYVLSKDYIDGVLIGVDSANQLMANLKAADVSIPNKESAAVDQIKVLNTELLNPSNWNK